MGLPLEAGAAAALAARTEGWVAGLQLAGLALRDEADPAAFVAAFAGSNQYVLDYLLEEVFARLPAHLQRFLLQTSVLERLSGPICDAVLGIETQPGDSYSQLLLRELEQRQLFLVSLDTERRWYRYHHLFAEALRARLRDGLPAEQIQELYRRAALAEPSPERTVGYLLEGRLWEEAGARIEVLGEALLAQGEHITLREWLQRLPAANSTRPRLQLLHGIASGRHGQLDRAEALLASALAGSRAQGDVEGQGMALTELALLALLRGEADTSMERFEQASKLPLPPHLRARTLLYATGVYLITDRLEELERNAVELLALLSHTDDSHLLITFLLGANALASGVFSQLAPLELLCRRGLALLNIPTRLPGVSAQAALALIAWQRGRLDEALHGSEQVLAAGEQVGGYATLAPQMLSVSAGVMAVRGELERAGALLEEALRHAHGGLYDVSRPGLLYALARVRWQQGRPAAVRRLAAELGATPSPRFGAFTGVIGTLVNGLAALAEGALDRAEVAFDEVAAQEAAVGLMPAFGSAHPLRAHMALAAGRPAEARALLEPLLTRCTRDDTPGRLLFEGPYIVPLLRLAAAEGAPAPIAARTLAIWESQQPAPRGT
jgi:LuxR family transcriptional regulator, maltose regulon positive regulatory protein